MELSRRWLENFACCKTPRLLVAVVLPLALAACGGSGTGSSGVSPEPPAAATTPKVALAAATPKDLVLAGSDVGDGWTVVPSETRAITVAEAVDGDSAALLKIERPAYRSGYEVLYTNPQKKRVAASQVYRYANPTVARRIYRLGLRDVARRNPGYKPMKAPPGAPHGVSMFRGTVKTKTAGTVPLYVAFWLRGKDIGCVFVIGKSTSPLLLALLASKQDQRMAAAATAGV